jgi:Flp pilus assembly protein TadG
MIRRLEKRKRKGVVMLLFTMMMLFIILPAVGLAVDAGVMFAIKAKMQSAADGAALSAARSLSRGYTFSSQQTAAAATALKFYRINIENGFLGLNSAADPVVTFPDTQINTMAVRVEVQVSAPTYFMRILGPSSMTLRTHGQVSRRFVNLVLVLDRSTSLQLSGSCTPMKTGATEFTQAFVNGTDNLALVTFGTSYRLDFDLANDFLARASPNNIPAMISNLNCSGFTNASSGYSKAAARLIQFNQPGALNVMVFFTDGLPTAVHLPAIPITSTTTCVNTSTRNGVVNFLNSTTYGVNIANEPNAPGSVPSNEYNRPVDDTDIENDTTAGYSNPNNDGCAFKTNTTGLSSDTNRLTLPGSANFVDYFGNSLTGSMPVTTGGTSPNHYISLSATNIENISTNALISASTRYRQLAATNGLSLTTFAIGLGNTTNPPDADLLKKVSNDPTSPSYNSTYPSGKMVYASNNDELHAAFARLASEILRITM